MGAHEMTKRTWSEPECSTMSLEQLIERLDKSEKTQAVNAMLTKARQLIAERQTARP